MLLLAAQTSFAQVALGYPTYNDSPQVVSVNRERLIQNSAFGKALNQSLSKQQKILVEENESLARNLEREELELTGLRKSLTPDEFSPLAEAFDVKVKEARRGQDQKAIDLAKSLEGARFRFFRQAERVIAQLMKENGIVFVLDESAVWISQGGDITNLVIERLDSAYEEGELALE
jgi:Skp family chaperone for outer membrane proteins